MKELILVSKLKQIHLQILPSNWSKEVDFRLSQRPAAFQVITWQIIWVCLTILRGWRLKD